MSTAAAPKQPWPAPPTLCGTRPGSNQRHNPGQLDLPDPEKRSTQAFRCALEHARLACFAAFGSSSSRLARTPASTRSPRSLSTRIAVTNRCRSGEIRVDPHQLSRSRLHRARLVRHPPLGDFMDLPIELGANPSTIGFQPCRNFDRFDAGHRPNAPIAHSPGGCRSSRSGRYRALPIRTVGAVLSATKRSTRRAAMAAPPPWPGWARA